MKFFVYKDSSRVLVELFRIQSRSSFMSHHFPLVLENENAHEEINKIIDKVRNEKPKQIKEQKDIKCVCLIMDEITRNKRLSANFIKNQLEFSQISGQLVVMSLDYLQKYSLPFYLIEYPVKLNLPKMIVDQIYDHWELCKSLSIIEILYHLKYGSWIEEN